MTPRALRGTLLCLAAGLPWAAAAQPARRAVVPELRGELAGSSPLLLAGAGLFTDAGLYARVGATVGAGTYGSGTHPLVVEAAFVGRFLLDPLRQARRGVYAGGGLGVRVGRGETRPFLLATLGVEGRRARAGVAPAVEVGVGGGARLSVVLRRARADRR